MTEWSVKAQDLRQRLWTALNLPAPQAAQQSEVRKEHARPGFRVQCVIYETEPGQYIPANLYLPADTDGPVGALLVTCGHGGSKSVPDYQYFGQLAAQMGYACLIADPIGEEERQKEGLIGTRDHDKTEATARSERAGRNIMGKLVWDAMAGVTYLQSRPEVDPARIAVTGYSLGGTICSYLIGLETRICAAIPVGWACRASDVGTTKACTSLPLEKMLRFMTTGELVALGAPHCAVLFALGDSDRILDRPGCGGDATGMRAVRELAETLEQARQVYEMYGQAGKLRLMVVPGADHQPLQVGKQVMLFVSEFLGEGRFTASQLLALPEIRLGAWLARHRLPVEKLYSTPHRMPGTLALALEPEPFPADELRCLAPAELGDPRFTLDGWLDSLER